MSRRIRCKGSLGQPTKRRKLNLESAEWLAKGTRVVVTVSTTWLTHSREGDFEVAGELMADVELGDPKALVRFPDTPTVFSPEYAFAVPIGFVDVEGKQEVV